MQFNATPKLKHSLTSNQSGSRIYDLRLICLSHVKANSLCKKTLTAHINDFLRKCCVDVVFLAHASGSCVGAYTASRPVPFMYMPDQP